MKTEERKAQHPFVTYQVRVGRGVQPPDIVDDLTHRVWSALNAGSDPIDPHRWPGLHRMFQDVFRKRMFFYEDCGHLEECRRGAAPPRPVKRWPETIYILHVPHDMEKFQHALAALAYRRFRETLPVLPAENREARLKQMKEAVEGVLSDFVCYSKNCQNCRALCGFADRRIWFGGGSF